MLNPLRWTTLGLALGAGLFVAGCETDWERAADERRDVEEAKHELIEETREFEAESARAAREAGDRYREEVREEAADVEEARRELIEQQREAREAEREARREEIEERPRTIDPIVPEPDLDLVDPDTID